MLRITRLSTPTRSGFERDILSSFRDRSCPSLLLPPSRSSFSISSISYYFFFTLHFSLRLVITCKIYIFYFYFFFFFNSFKTIKSYIFILNAIPKQQWRPLGTLIFNYVHIYICICATTKRVYSNDEYIYAYVKVEAWKIENIFICI